MESIANNQANVIGIVENEKEFSHRVYGEDFYIFTLRVPRLSGMDDFLKVMASERLMDDVPCNVGDKIEVSGQFAHITVWMSWQVNWFLRFLLKI